MKRVPWWVWVGLFAVIAWSATSGSGDDETGRAGASSPPAYSQRASRPDTADAVDHRHRDRRRPPRERHAQSTDLPPEPTRSPSPAPSPTPASPHTYLVVHVVDGDTLDLGNGERVRLVGIDTPEVGECGYDAAAAALARTVLHRHVRLTISDEDRDRYGRLLRYVDVGRTDAGLEMIRRGLAIARYDSRDGYGFHPREPQYVAADRGSKPLCAGPAPLAAPGPPGSGRNCAPGYTPCVPPGPPDLDCSDVDGPIRVTGSDPHRLDGDGDGVACE